MRQPSAATIWKVYIFYVCYDHLRMSCISFLFGFVYGYMRHIVRIPMVFLPIYFRLPRLQKTDTFHNFSRHKITLIFALFFNLFLNFDWTLNLQNKKEAILWIRDERKERKMKGNFPIRSFLHIILSLFQTNIMEKCSVHEWWHEYIPTFICAWCLNYIKMVCNTLMWCAFASVPLPVCV